MSRIEMLMQVTQILRPADGWVCRALSNTKVTMEHQHLGKKIAVLVGGKQMVVRK